METRAIVKSVVKSRKEIKFSQGYTYDDFVNATSLDLDPLGTTPFPAPVLTNIYNGVNQSATIIGMAGGFFLNTPCVDLNTQFPGAVVPLAGMSMARGDTSFTIDGNYAYMQSRKLSLQINAMPTKENDSDKLPKYQAPLVIRLIHISYKNNALNEPSLLNSLFVNHIGAKKGLASDGSIKMLIHDWDINREQFTVHKDIKFKLQQIPAASTALSVNNAATTNVRVGAAFPSQNTPSYPQQKNIDLWLTKTSKKLRFATGISADNNLEPLNFNGSDMIFALITRETPANSALGQQVADQVQIRACTTNKYRDA